MSESEEVVDMTTDLPKSRNRIGEYAKIPRMQSQAKVILELTIESDCTRGVRVFSLASVVVHTGDGSEVTFSIKSRITLMRRGKLT
jgi:hypothetical protein